MGKEQEALSWYGMNSFTELFDDQFKLSDFCASLEKSESKSESTIDSAKIAIQRAFEKQEAETKLVVDISDDIKQAITRGEVRLETGKNGQVYAQLRKSNGQYGGKLSVKEELEQEGISAETLVLAMQMDMIKDQLEDIISGIKDVEAKVSEVIQGQRNDRIGLLYSGLSLYLEANAVSDEYLKKQLLSQALKSLNDANYQVIQDIRMSVEYLMTEKYKSSRKTMLENIQERVSIIKQCYEVVFRASFLKAAIYQENGEIAAMVLALDEYGRFIEKMILPYIGKLHELDKDSRFIAQSIWGQMAKSLYGCREIQQKLSSNDGYYLRLGGNENV